MIERLISFFETIYDRISRPELKEKLERWVMVLSVSGFLVHLLLIAAARTIPELRSGLLADLDRNFLHAIYTPFSFILFYEVLLLVLALPKSHTNSIGKQYEIVSLIVIRGVFKDLGNFGDPSTWLSQRENALMVLLDMLAAVLMFLLVAAFHRLSKTVAKSARHRQLHRFVTIKKAVAAFLCIVLVVLAFYNLGQWILSLFPVLGGGQTEGKDLDLFFFPAFFEFMIITDVFLLIVSIPFFEKYEYVIRNAGFVVSTVLLRMSLSTPKPYDLAIGLTAMVYGLSVLAVFSYYRRIEAKSDDGDLVTDLSSTAEEALD